MALALPGCATRTSGATGSPSSGSTCAASTLGLRQAGQLTVATQAVAYPPWFVDKDPSNEQGYESAFTYLVAQQLGFDHDHVTWTKTEFHDALAAGPKDFDLYVNQVSITEARREVVDFSSPYADIGQALIVSDGSPFARATRVGELKRARLGAVADSTSIAAIAALAPATAPVAFDNNEEAVSALESHHVDGIVVDLPTAMYFAGIRFDDQVVVGQLPQPADQPPEQYGILLQKASPLTHCVDQVVSALQSDGTLSKLEKRWLYSSGPPGVLS